MQTHWRTAIRFHLSSFNNLIYRILQKIGCLSHLKEFLEVVYQWFQEWKRH